MYIVLIFNMRNLRYPLFDGTGLLIIPDSLRTRKINSLVKSEIPNL